MTAKKILICGLPGSGKTTLGRALAKAIGGVLWDGDEVRQITGNRDFTVDGRITQARAMRDLCRITTSNNVHSVAAFVAPMHIMRDIFRADFTILIDRAVASPYQDTNRMWNPPVHPDFMIEPGPLPVTPAPYVTAIITKLFPGLPLLADARMLDVRCALDAIEHMVSNVRGLLPMRVYADVDRDKIIPPAPVLAGVHVADAGGMDSSHRRYSDPSGKSDAFDTFGDDDTVGC